MLSLMLVSTVGLFLLRPWSRTLFVVLTVVGLGSTPCLGPYAGSGWERPFNDAAMVLNGVIIGLIYFSPLKQLFEKRATESYHTTIDLRGPKLKTDNKSTQRNLIMHVVCGWPLVLVLFGGGMGGGLSGAAYATSLVLYRKGAPVWMVIVSSVLLGTVAIGTWAAMAQMVGNR